MHENETLTSELNGAVLTKSAYAFNSAFTFVYTSYIHFMTVLMLYTAGKSES